MNARILSIILAFSFLVFIIELVRREKLTFKYAAGWIAVSMCGISAAIFDKFLYKIAIWLGFQLTSNFIFYIVLCGLVFMNLLLTIFLCHQNSRNDRMAQKIGLWENEINEIRKKITKE